MNRRPAAVYARTLFFTLKIAADAARPSKTLSSANPAACIQCTQPASSLTFSSIVLGVYPCARRQSSKPWTCGFAKCSRLSTLFQCLRFCFSMLASFLCLEAAACDASPPPDRRRPDHIPLSTDDRSHLDLGGISLSDSFGRFRARLAVATSTNVAGASRSLGLRDGARLHRRARWCGDVVSPLWASEPVLSLGTAVVHASRQAFDWRIWRHDAVAVLPALAPQWLARELLPLGVPPSSRDPNIARPAILRCAAGLKAAGRPSRR